MSTALWRVAPTLTLVFQTRTFSSRSTPAPSPGSVENEATLSEVDAHESEKEVRSVQPIRRKGTAAEVTSLMLHLASENAGFITGQSYLVNGGMYFQ